jgi:prepilin-type processing-associated H-X9-DG protein
MKKLKIILIACWLPAFQFAGCAGPARPAPQPAVLSLREILYHGRLSDDEARFVVDVEATQTGRGESSLSLFEGDVAVLPAKLPDSLKIVRNANRYLLVSSRPGKFKFQLEVVARIQHNEPWNQISFAGPPATISSVIAQAGGTGMEVQLLNGTLLESVRTNGVSQVKGYLGADQTVALRWQSKAAEVARKTMLTVESTVTARIAPTVIKYTSQFHYDIIQGNAAQLSLALPASQALTRLVGEQIRDWHTTTDGNRQILSVEFIKPLEKNYDLTLYSEQTVDDGTGGGSAALNPPQPLEVERESGSLTLASEDTLVEIGSLGGLRQINAPDQALAAYRFNARPFALLLKLKRIEPVLNAADHITARLDETRLLISHRLALDVKKAGIYLITLTPPPGFAVADVRGDGIEDWKVTDAPAGKGKVLTVNFSARVLGARQVDIQLEQALKNFPDRISVTPIRVAGAGKETAQIGAVCAPGIRIKTAALDGLREIPVNRLLNHGDELLAYSTERPDWNLSLTSERLAARIVADVFNLVTIGDGIVGGSATIRYSLINQGVQEFKVKLPPQCRNVDFTGPNIRRKEQSGDVWTIGLQDKAWGGYTLVVTYDYPFDPRGATLSIGGLHPLDAERETGSLAVATAASLQLSPGTVSETLRRIDENELSAADRSLITRAVVLAYQYAGDQYDLAVAVKRYAEQPVIEAVADRTQITSVLTEAGEMLTEASFMVKNNEKQFQGFHLPQDAKLWGCYVNGRPAKPEQNGEEVLVPLPRDRNRDQAIAVDIVYAQTNGALASHWVRTLALTAPRTDVPNTYAEWQLFVPPSLRLSGFGGSMNVAQGTTYELLDAWQKFLAFYGQVLREAGGAILAIGCLAFLVIALVISAVRRGWNGVITVLAVVAILAVLGAMLLPALAKAKQKAQRISSANNLKQIGLAVRLFSQDNNDRLPASFEEMKNELNTDKITYDPQSGQRYTYLGNGLYQGQLKPESVLAFSPIVDGACSVLFADGHVDNMSAAQFGELSQRGLVQLATPEAVAQQQQRAAVMSSQFATTTVEPPAPAPATPGLRSFRIELPQTGQPFLFTKVLNVNDEPLSIRAHVMPLRTFLGLQMAWQVAAFLLGLAVWWWQWHHRRRSFVLTLALALILGSVGSLLIQWRALHDALIVGFPIVTLAIIAGLIWKYWPRGQQPEPADNVAPEPPALGGTLPPVAAAIVLTFLLGTHSLSAADTGTASIVSAQYSGAINDRVAQLDASIRFTATQAGQIIPLFGDDVALQEFNVKDGDARLVRDGNRIAVQFGNRENTTLQIKMLVKVAGDVTRRHLAFGIPPALSSQIRLTVDEPEADVDFPTAISFRRILDRDKTHVDAVIGSGERVELLWTPRVKRAAEVAATVFCQNSALATFGGGVVNVTATLNYQVTQGELRQARVRLPAGQRLLHVQGQAIRTWEVRTDNGAPYLVVDMLKGISQTWQLTVETEQVLASLPADIPVEIPHAVDVKRETGLVALRNTEELGLSVESASDLQRVDVEEFPRPDADQTGGLLSVFRFSNPVFGLRIRAEVVQPQIEAVARHNVRIGTEQITLHTILDYHIRRVGVFTLRVAVPGDYRVEQVTGNNILQWAERAAVEPGLPGGLSSSNATVRVLEITLKERTSGSYTLNLELIRSFKELPPTVAITGVQPLQTEKLTTYIAVSAEPGVAVRTESLDGLTEIPAAALPDTGTPGEAGGVLAYKLISSNPKPSPEWTLNVASETVTAWVRAEIVDTITLTETLLSGRAQIRYDIGNAPVKELRVKIPAEFRNVEITGPNIRSREQAGDSWRVELQSKTRGFYTLTVTWEQSRSSRTNLVPIAGVAAENVERETGLLAIVARTPLQVTELKSTDVQRVDTGDLPDWAGAPEDATVLAYRYARPGYQLSVEARRYDEAEVLRALVDSAHFTTVVADDGQVMTEMTLSVRNNGRQFLEIELPQGAVVWSAFVAGQPVRPSRNNGKLLLPIESSGSGDGSISVEVTYAGTNVFPRARGTAEFASPKFDVPLKNARWELFLPPDYSYREFSGTMTREIAAAQPSATSFSLWDYSRMEKASLESARADVQRDFFEARRQLDSGNVREATANFNRARGKVYGGKEGDVEVKKLEKDLQAAQASNLINAQSEFTVRNGAADVPAPGAGPVISTSGITYDNTAAEQQWAKLQQAQEIVAAKVQPLRVNLPLRGLHYSFVQVLQTEGGKPMTIRLLAASAKIGSWPKQVATALLGFALLWGAVAATLRVTRHAASRS